VKFINRLLLCVLVIAILSTFVCAETGLPAPPFTARTLDGETLTNASLRGHIVLLQFWATWCPYCRQDQPIVDRLERMFAPDGLTVLTFDSGESESTVRSYLRENPRAARVALDPDKRASKAYGSHGVPFYVLLDKSGNILDTQNGSGGEASLLDLLKSAGLSPATSGSRRTAQQQSVPDKPLIIEAQGAEQAMPVTPNPKTIFILANGERLESERYTIGAGVLHATVDGKQRTMPLSALNMNATKSANRQRGIDLKIPASRSEVLLAF
jgi:thiol-disulfide isomerase/thioredoxin